MAQTNDEETSFIIKKTDPLDELFIAEEHRNQRFDREDRINTYLKKHFIEPNKTMKNIPSYGWFRDFLLAYDKLTHAKIKEVERQARLASLDDCKTLLEKVLSETQDDNHKCWAGPTYGLKRALAELEALRKKVEG